MVDENSETYGVLFDTKIKLNILGLLEISLM
jgi:hypothetical protein